MIRELGPSYAKTLQRHLQIESASSHKSLRSVAFHVFHALPVVTCTTLFSMQFLLSRKGTSFIRRLLELLPTFHSYMYCKWLYQIYWLSKGWRMCKSIQFHCSWNNQKRANSCEKFIFENFSYPTPMHYPIPLFVNQSIGHSACTNYSVWLLNYTWFGKKATKVLCALAIACTCAEPWNHLVTGETSKRTYRT